MGIPRMPLALLIGISSLVLAESFLANETIHNRHLLIEDFLNGGAFADPFYRGSNGTFEGIAASFRELFEELLPGECDDNLSEIPVVDPCAEFLEIVGSILKVVQYFSCQSISELNPKRFFTQAIVAPLLSFADGSETCDERRSLRGLKKKKKKGKKKGKDDDTNKPTGSPTSPPMTVASGPSDKLLNRPCVERFAEGNYDGLLGRAPAAFGLEGGTNQYAWGTDFNEEVGLGVVIHSTGSPGALTGGYSLPTFSIRNRTGHLVFEGVLDDPRNGKAPLTVGLRSALVLEVKKSEVKILAATLSLTEGSFLIFELDLDDYSGEPIRGLAPVEEVPFGAPSVRAIRRISDSLVLYAPNFDIGGSTGFSFLKVFNWRSLDIIKANLVITDTGIDEGKTEASFRPGFVWDFECQDEGLCFVNTLLFSENDILPTTSFFPLREITSRNNAFILSPSVDRNIIIPSITMENTFTIDYSAQSFEPISADTSVVCTLSGFLFQLAAIRNLSDFVLSSVQGGRFDLPGLSSISSPDFEGTLASLELGDPQQCEICTGFIPPPSTTTDPPTIPPTTPTSDDDKKDKKKKKKGKKKKKKEKRNLQSAGCIAANLVDQLSTTAYVWAVEECGGKVFVGTYDIGSVFGEIVLDVFIRVQAEVACRSFIVQQLACGLNGPCRNGNNREVCLEFVTATAQRSIQFTERSSVSSGFVSALFEEEITPDDFGFDLYYADTEDLLSGDNLDFLPLTQNGFRELSPPRPIAPGLDSLFGSFFDIPFVDNIFNSDLFDSTSQLDEAIRNMVCHKDPATGVETLIVGSAVLRTDSTSNTYVVDTSDRCIPP